MLRIASRAAEFRGNRWRIFLAASIFVAVCGCHRILPADMTPLDSAGMNYSSVQALRSLGVSNSEVAELVTAHNGGLSDDGCVALVRLVHGENKKFDSGEQVAGLLRAGVSETAVIALAKLQQLHSWGGEAQAMRLAGLSDEMILEAAQRRAASQNVLSGDSLANMKNAGMSNGTLLQLIRRGVPDSQTKTIILMKRRGYSDAQILRRYPG